MSDATTPDDSWRVLPHGPLERLETNLWRLEGTLPNMPLKRVMTVVRLASGQLVIHNPIAAGEEARRALEALGPVSSLVIPNGWHRLDSRAFVGRYPGARVYAPLGSRAKVAAFVPVAGTFAEFPPNETITLEELDGTMGREGVMRVRSEGRLTLVLADAIFNMPHLPGLQGFVLRHLTQSSGGPRISRVGRWVLVKDRVAFAAHLERLAELDPVRIIVAHHLPITQKPAAVLHALASSLRP